MLLLAQTGNLLWAAVSCTLLFAQFAVVYWRLLPYLAMTFGRSSLQYRVFLLFGFPVGLLCLDVLMFLEPFGLLTSLPLPERLRQFVPGT